MNICLAYCIFVYTTTNHVGLYILQTAYICYIYIQYILYCIYWYLMAGVFLWIPSRVGTEIPSLGFPSPLVGLDHGGHAIANASCGFDHTAILTQVPCTKLPPWKGETEFSQPTVETYPYSLKHIQFFKTTTGSCRCCDVVWQKQNIDSLHVVPKSFDGGWPLFVWAK